MFVEQPWLQRVVKQVNFVNISPKNHKNRNYLQLKSNYLFFLGQKKCIEMVFKAMLND